MSVIEGVNTMQTNATTGAGLGYEVSRAEAQISSALGLSDDFSASTATTGRVMVGVKLNKESYPVPPSSA